MSGHSKWANIKHRKAAVDQKRAKVFTRLAKELTIAARDGGDPDMNSGLRLALAKARAANMPAANIERAIKRGTGEIEGGDISEILYEVYAPHGIGMLVEVVTDNKNRAIAEIRHILNKYGGSMASTGAVAWQFSRKGYLSVSQVADPDAFFMLAAEAGADDVQFGEGAEVYTTLDNFLAVRSALEEAGFELAEATMIYDPDNPVQLPQDEAVQVMRIIELLEDLDDVQDVYSSLDITDDALEAMEA